MTQQDFVYQGAIHNLGSILEQYSGVRIFLVRGGNSYQLSGAQKLIERFTQNKHVTEYKDFSVNPKYDEAERGFHIFDANNCNIILCVGGGSVIDMGKLIKHLAVKGGNENFHNPEIPLIAIPTTAGTGSEATHFAVVYVNEEKQSIASDALLPNIAIVDANLLSSQSKYQIASSGFDAFAQGVESYWNINSTKESLEYAELAIKLIWNNLLNAINGVEGSYNLIAKGSFYSGKAINITKTTAPHAFSYGFTSLFGLPHGHAVALFLPFFAYFHSTINKDNCNDNKGYEYVRNKMISISEFLNTSIDQLDKAIVNFALNIGLEINFKLLKISLENYNEALKHKNFDRLKNNPGIVNEEILSKIYLYNCLIE